MGIHSGKLSVNVFLSGGVLSPKDAEGHEFIYISFGKVNRGNGTEYGYEEDPQVLQEEIEGRYDRILKNRQERLKNEEEREKMKQSI